MGPLTGLGASDLAAAMSTYRDVLRQHQETINRLNVYPVPDGDTGTNMALTLEAVVAEIAGIGDSEPADPSVPAGGSEPAGPSMARVCKAVAHGSLMGARGNSGVILSQLLRGLTGVLAGAEEASGPALAEALAAADEAARQAVLRPVEGTILTVARAAAEGAQVAAKGGGGILQVAEGAREAAAEALART
ncbi:MAG TPA: DAK2 domain-containing protein, partial [Acidimicrobiales bacterium]|nr:DAK2 domain-containing protein [Acidimicrobiales bacterium]